MMSFPGDWWVNLAIISWMALMLWLTVLWAK